MARMRSHLYCQIEYSFLVQNILAKSIFKSQDGQFFRWECKSEELEIRYTTNFEFLNDLLSNSIVSDLLN